MEYASYISEPKHLVATFYKFNKSFLTFFLLLFVQTLSNLENYRSEDILRGTFPLEYKVQECPKLMVKGMVTAIPFRIN